MPLLYIHYIKQIIKANQMISKLIKVQQSEQSTKKQFISLASFPKQLNRSSKTPSSKPSSPAQIPVQIPVSKQNVESVPKHNVEVINVFTDGSCIQSSQNKNGNRPAGYACVFPEYPKYSFAGKLEGKEKTNNRAEFTACIVAFQIADKIDPSYQKPLKVFTDSELLINSLTKWLNGWKAKNWKKADGSPVKNVDLLKTLDELMKKRKVVFKHVRAHTGKKDWESVNNDLADQMAKKAAFSK
jgi:ribonuclease HI